MGVEQYLHRLGIKEDILLTQASLLYRRFNRLGLETTIADLDFPLKPTEETPNPLDKKVYRDFTGDEIGLIQLGEFTVLNILRIHPEYKERSEQLIERYMNPGIIGDYNEAQQKRSEHKPEDIIEATRQYGINEEFIKILRLTKLLSKTQEEETEETTTKQKIPTSIPEEAQEWIKQTTKPLPPIITEKDIKKIDKYLQSKI